MKNTILKSIILSLALMAGVNSVWAGAGIFYGQVNLLNDGNEYIVHTNDWSSGKSFDNIKSIGINSIYIKVWKDNSGNICSATLHYNIWEHGGGLVHNGSQSTGYDSFLGNNDHQWKKENLNIDSKFLNNS